MERRQQHNFTLIYFDEIVNSQAITVHLGIYVHVYELRLRALNVCTETQEY